MNIELVSLIGAGATAVISPVLSWLLDRGGAAKRGSLAVREAFQNYTVELKANRALLRKVKVDEIDTKNIAGAGELAAGLSTDAAHALLLAIAAAASNPPQALKAAAGKAPKKQNVADAEAVIKTLIASVDRIDELKQFSKLSEPARKFLRGFYVRARIKHIREKTEFLGKALLG